MRGNTTLLNGLTEYWNIKIYNEHSMPSGSGWNLRYITLSNEEERGRKRKRGGEGEKEREGR